MNDYRYNIVQVVALNKDGNGLRSYTPYHQSVNKPYDFLSSLFNLFLNFQTLFNLKYPKDLLYLNGAITLIYLKFN